MNLPTVTSLAECEAVIERGLGTFVEVGQALGRIRDERLHLESHSTFEDYCRERWGMDRTYAHRTIQASAVVEMLPIGNTPPSEAVARELAPLREKPALLRKVWERALAASEHPTAAEVKAIRGEVLPAAKAPKLPQPADYLEHLLPSAAPGEALHARIVAALRDLRDIGLELDGGTVPFVPTIEEDRGEFVAALDLAAKTIQRLKRRTHAQD